MCVIGVQINAKPNQNCYEECLTTCYTMSAVPQYWCPNLCSQHCVKNQSKLEKNKVLVCSNIKSLNKYFLEIFCFFFKIKTAGCSPINTKKLPIVDFDCFWCDSDNYRKISHINLK